MSLRRALPFALLAGCGAEPPQLGPPPAPSLAPAVRAPPPLPVWLPNPEDGRTLTVAAGKQTWIVGGGLRAAFTAGAPPLVVPGPALTGVLPLRPSQGGGAVFWSDRAIFRATSFEAPLRPLRAFSSGVTRVEPHPEGLLVSTPDGQVLVDASSGARLRASPLGAVDLAVASDGSALARLLLGDVVRWDGGWKPLALTDPAVGVVAVGDALYVHTDGKTLRVSPDGGLGEAPAPKPAPRVLLGVEGPGWYRPPLPQALLSGLPLGPTSALWLGPEGLYAVSLLDGTAQRRAAWKPPPDTRCELAAVLGSGVWTGEGGGPLADLRNPFPEVADPPVVGDGVILCTGKSASVWSGLSGVPSVEHKLPAGGVFFVGDDGALAYVAQAPAKSGEAPPPPPPPPPPPIRGKRPRPPDPKPPVDPSSLVVWSRTGRGSWSELQVSAGLALLAPPREDSEGEAPAQPEEEPFVFVRAVPAQAGPLLLYRQGSRLFQVDVTRGVHAEIQLPPTLTGLARSLERGLDGSVDRAASARPGGGFTALLASHANVDVGPDGTAIDLSTSAYDLSVHGARGLARRSGGLYQTVDRGRHWARVEDPPGGTFQRPHCGTLGCQVGALLRIGFRPDPPGGAAPPSLSAAPVENARPLPSLRCSLAGKLDRKSVRRLTDDGLDDPQQYGLGAIRLAKKPGDLATFFSTSRVPFGWRDGSRNPLAFAVNDTPGAGAQPGDRVLHSVDLFEPSGVVRRGKQPMGPLLAQYTMHGLTLDLSAIAQTTPVLPEEPARGKKASAPDLLLEHGGEPGTGGAYVVWNGRDPRLGWDAGLGDQTLSAVARAGSVVVLRGNGHVRRLTSAGAAELRALPELGFGSRVWLGVSPDGSLGLLYVPTDLPPTADDPALLVPLLEPDLTPSRKGTAAGVPLAPWSTLTPASAPACQRDKAGARALLSLSRSWVRTEMLEEDYEDMPMLAVVRWGAERVCLEALELAQASWVEERWLVARFDEGGRAALLRIDLGLEERQPLTCALETP